MKIKLYFSLGGIALFVLLSGRVMALDFPITMLPGTGGGGNGGSQAILIFSCKNAGMGANTSGNSSCSGSGSSSSCSSSSGASHGSIAAWEMTADRPALKTLLNDVNTSCSEAVEFVGYANCNPSGGNELTVYTCKI